MLLVGASGSGKSTIANQLANEKGWRVLQSYTTRPKRHPNETGHIFVKEEDFFQHKDRLCAYTEFDGYKYWATEKQINDSDIYIIDPAGVERLTQWKKRNAEASKKKFLIIKLSVSESIRKARMLERGDSESSIKRRLAHDKGIFKGFKKGAFVSTKGTIDETAQHIYEMAQTLDEYLDHIAETDR